MSEFTINKDKKTRKKEKVAEVYTFSKNKHVKNADGYPIIPIEDSTLEDILAMKDAYAVLVEDGIKTRYYVRRGRHGRLFNPIGMYSEGNSGKQLRHAGKPEWVLNECPEKIFKYYIEFLKTKNIAWLNNAEREI